MAATVDRPAGEQHPKSDNRGDQHDDAAHQSGQLVVEIAALSLALTFPALGFGLVVIGVDVHHAVAYAEVDETEHTRGHAQQHHAYRPALLDAQGLLAVNGDGHAEKNQPDATHHADGQFLGTAGPVIIGVEVLNERVPAHELRMRHARRNQECQTDDHPDDGADESEELASGQQAGNRALAVEQHTHGHTGNDGGDPRRNLPGERVHMGVVSGQVLRQRHRNGLLPYGDVRRKAISRGLFRGRIARRRIRRQAPIADPALCFGKTRRTHTIGRFRRCVRHESRSANIAEHQIVKRATEQVADHQQLIHLRVRLAGFPLGDGLARDAKQHGKPLLCEVALRPQILQIIPKAHRGCLLLNH